MTPSPTISGLAWAFTPLLALMGILAWQGLGQVRPLAIATVRLVIQLTLLGLVLRGLFAARHPALVLAVVLLMLAASAHAVGSRQGGNSWLLRSQAFLALAIGAGVCMAVGTRLALGVEPWYDPRTVIPLLGMVLNYGVSGVSLAAERLESEVRSDREGIELRLALGATTRQAVQPALRATVRAALTPLVNSMMIAGVVAIPGMMTGHLLAGSEVATAVRYQVLVYFLIAGASGIGTLVLLWLRLGHHFTADHQLRRVDDGG